MTFSFFATSGTGLWNEETVQDEIVADEEEPLLPDQVEEENIEVFSDEN
jgi:hypothetical protein